MALDQEDVTSEGELSLIEHLTELRKRVVYSLIAILIFMAGALVFSDIIMEFITDPIRTFLPDQKIFFTGPMDVFLAHLKIALLSGVILSCPFWLYQVWKFVEPGLYDNEKKYGLGFIFSGTVLFLTGVSFVYYLVYPMAFGFLLQYDQETAQAMITIKEYLGFFTLTTLVFGAAFELPLILTILGIIGVIDQQFLRDKRRYAIVIIITLSAVITPPDVISQVMLGVPLVALYEVSIIMIGILGRKPPTSTDVTQ